MRELSCGQGKKDIIHIFFKAILQSNFGHKDPEMPQNMSNLGCLYRIGLVCLRDVNFPVRISLYLLWAIFRYKYSVMLSSHVDDKSYEQELAFRITGTEISLIKCYFATFWNI
jgi:hypothetical protein